MMPSTVKNEIQFFRAVNVARRPPAERAEWVQLWGRANPSEFNALLRNARLYVYAQQALSAAPEYKRREPFLFHWQCAIDAVGVRAVSIAASVAGGQHWNASNVFELPMDLSVLRKKMNYEQTHIAGLMACLFAPRTGWQFADQRGLIFQRNYKLSREARVLMLNLIASYRNAFSTH